MKRVGPAALGGRTDLIHKRSVTRCRGLISSNHTACRHAPHRRVRRGVADLHMTGPTCTHGLAELAPPAWADRTQSPRPAACQRSGNQRPPSARPQPPRTPPALRSGPRRPSFTSRSARRSTASVRGRQPAAAAKPRTHSGPAVRDHENITCAEVRHYLLRSLRSGPPLSICFKRRTLSCVLRALHRDRRCATFSDCRKTT